MTSSRTRRRLLLGGLAASAGAGLTTAPQAEAATVPPVLLGRSNTAGSRSTSLTATAGGVAWRVVQRGAGIGAAVHAQATALLGISALSSGWALHGSAAATRTGTGGAVRAQGRRNAGLLADTTVQDVPAVVAIGGDGSGVAQVATGQSYLDGDAMALRSWTGVLAADGLRVSYAPVLSGEGALHTAAGNVVLDGAGAAVVALPATFTAACDTAGLVVTLTAVDTAMPGLSVAYRQQEGAAAGVRDAFTVSGGASGGTVAWTAWAPRRAVDLQHAQAGVGQGALAPGVESPDDRAFARPAMPARLGRRPLRLPAR